MGDEIKEIKRQRDNALMHLDNAHNEIERLEKSIVEDKDMLIKYLNMRCKELTGTEPEQSDDLETVIQLTTKHLYEHKQYL